MDPLTIGILVGVAASSAAAALGWRGGKRAVPPPATSNEVPIGAEANPIHVGDVLTYLGEEYWLAGEIAVMREGTPAIRVFSAPQQGGDRWLALPRQGNSVWVMREERALDALGWPGIELPASGRTLRRSEHGNAAFVIRGEGLADWDGVGRFATFRAHDSVALAIERHGTQRLTLIGREIPRELVQKLG